MRTQLGQHYLFSVACWSTKVLIENFEDVQSSRTFIMSEFSAEQFLADLERTSDAIVSVFVVEKNSMALAGSLTNSQTLQRAPYSKAVTEGVIRAYDQSFHRGAVLWRATDRLGDALNYRFYERESVDLLSIAIHAEFLKQDHPLVLMLRSWSAPWSGGVPEQSCDFDAKKGLTKLWAYQAGFRPLHDLLSMDGIPYSICQHEKRFCDLGLHTVRHVAADFCSDTVNFYFRISDSLFSDHAVRLVQLADPLPPSSAELQEIQRHINPTGFTFAVTIKINTGDILRVAFYALGLSPKSLPDLGNQVNTFFEEAPSYDDKTFTALAWSFGWGGERYIKAEKSYCGELLPLVRSWNSNLTSEREETRSNREGTRTDA